MFTFPFLSLYFFYFHQGPTTAPTPAPTPVGGAPCEDAEGKVAVSFDGKDWKKPCGWLAAKNHCGKPAVDAACPVSCNACGGGDGGDDPTAAPTESSGGGDPTCEDAEGKVAASFDGKEWKKPCKWFKARKYCGNAAVDAACPKSCDACRYEGDSSTGAPTDIPTNEPTLEPTQELT